MAVNIAVCQAVVITRMLLIRGFARLHRAVALPILFAEVKLQFRRPSSGPALPSTSSSNSTLHDRQRSKAAEELLERVASDPTFGTCVKSLKIIGWVRASTDLEGEYYSTRCYR